jgi:hypothetical protein
MDTQQIHAACTEAGIAPEAVDAVRQIVQAHFGDALVKPADLTAFLRTIPVWEKLGMDKAQWDKMPATWRLAQGRAQQPPPGTRRPTTRHLTAEELERLQYLSRHERHERGRQLQHTPLPKQPSEP